MSNTVSGSVVAEQANEMVSVADLFQEKHRKFVTDVNQMVEGEVVPPWFRNFSALVCSFANDVGSTVKHLESTCLEIEGHLAVQKAVTEGLDTDRHRLMVLVDKLQEELEDQQQYSRRTNILIHGVVEEKGENVEEKVLELLSLKMDLPISRYEIGRTHRLGRKRLDDNHKRPIIVRFVSNRQKEMVFQAKTKLRGSKIGITENLTKQRYQLYKECKDFFGNDQVYSYDGRIYCYTGDKDSRVTENG